MKNIDRQGFTLIELLAALVILGLLMLVAAPNVLGILNRNKSELYVEDAKKLVARAEYVMRGDTSIKKPTGTGTNCVGFSLAYLDNSEFNDPPQGGEYFVNKSYVKVCKQNNEYKYYVQLLECEKKNITTSGSNKVCSTANGYKGIRLMGGSGSFAGGSEVLYTKTAVQRIVKGSSSFDSIRSAVTTAANRYCDIDIGCAAAMDNVVINND